MKATVQSSRSEPPGDPPKEKTHWPTYSSYQFANLICPAPWPVGFLLDSASERCGLQTTGQGTEAESLCLWRCRSCWIELAVTGRGLQTPVAGVEVTPFLWLQPWLTGCPGVNSGLAVRVSVKLSSRCRPADFSSFQGVRVFCSPGNTILPFPPFIPCTFSSVLPALVTPPTLF